MEDCHQTHHLKIALEELEVGDRHQTHHLKIALEELEVGDHHQTHHHLVSFYPGSLVAHPIPLNPCLPPSGCSLKRFLHS